MDGCPHDDSLAIAAKVDFDTDGDHHMRYHCGICDARLGKHEPIINDYLYVMPGPVKGISFNADQIPMQRIEDLEVPGAPGNTGPEAPIVYEGLEVTPFSQISTGRSWAREQGRFWPTHMSAFNRRRSNKLREVVRAQFVRLTDREPSEGELDSLIATADDDGFVGGLAEFNQ